MSVHLLQQTVDDQKIAENANAALRRFRMARYRSHIARPPSNGTEHVQFNGRFQGESPLKGLQVLEDYRWRQKRALRCGIRLHREVPQFREPQSAPLSEGI
jgi:hypothetical protein